MLTFFSVFTPKYPNEKRDNIYREISVLNLRIFSSYQNANSLYDSYTLSCRQVKRNYKIIN